MRRKALGGAKLVVTVLGNRRTGEIKTVSVFDNRTQVYWPEARIKERNIERFLDLNDMKETLNWNLNGDASKYLFRWGQTGKRGSEGIAYIFQ